MQSNIITRRTIYKHFSNAKLLKDSKLTFTGYTPWKTWIWTWSIRYPWRRDSGESAPGLYNRLHLTAYCSSWLAPHEGSEKKKLQWAPQYHACHASLLAPDKNIVIWISFKYSSANDGWTTASKFKTFVEHGRKECICCFSNVAQNTQTQEQFKAYFLNIN